MNWLDKELQRQRVRKALVWVPENARVLDLGCADGALFRLGRGRLAGGVGLDLVPHDVHVDGPFEFRTGAFPAAVVNGETFDAVTALAVVEYLPSSELAAWADAVPRLLRPDGVFILTVPSPAVDRLLHISIKLRLLDGMEAHEHHRFNPRIVPDQFASPHLTLRYHRTFQFGLNNLYVFART